MKVSFDNSIDTPVISKTQLFICSFLIFLFSLHILIDRMKKCASSWKEYQLLEILDLDKKSTIPKLIFRRTQSHFAVATKKEPTNVENEKLFSPHQDVCSQSNVVTLFCY